MKEIEPHVLWELGQMKAPGCPPTSALGLYLDGTLEPLQRQAVESHLRSCPACTNGLTDLRELAHLERAGEEPPADLVRKVKLMVRTPTSHVAASPSGRKRTAQVLSALSTTFRGALVRRFAIELAVACAAMLVVVRLAGWTISRQPAPLAAGSVSQVEGVADLSPDERTLLARLAPARSAESSALNTQVLSALEKLPKTLLLEETRGATDVAIYKKAAPSTVLVVTDQALGSGIVIDNAGDVLTNAHVIQGAQHVAVIFKPERGVAIDKDAAYVATPLKVDQVADLALLKVATPPRLPPALSVATMDTVEVGQDVHAIGHPDGEVWTYTTGVISQIRPEYQWTGSEDHLLHRGSVIQTQTAINPGNSGGPLLNDHGEVIGINSFRKEGEGLSYAVAADEVSNFLTRTTSQGAPKASAPASPAYRFERYGKKIAGVYLNSTVPPPDLWLVYRDAQGRDVRYAATGQKQTTVLDTVLEHKDAATVVYYLDVDCDGTIDLIGYAEAGAAVPSRYAKPAHAAKLASLMGELVTALANGSIPYKQIRVCP